MVEFQPEILRQSLELVPSDNKTSDSRGLAIQSPTVEEARQLNVQESANTQPKFILSENVPYANAVSEQYIQPMNYNGCDPKLFVKEEKINGVGINIYSFPLFTDKFCADFISAAEECGRWTSNRHENYPTTDIPLGDLVGPDGRTWDHLYEEYMIEYAYPMAIHVWGLENAGFLSENFIVKYDVDGQNNLGIHHDASVVTFISALNDGFRGGGTYFEKWDYTLKIPQGWVAFHPGYCGHKHGGLPVTSGKRYISISFAGKVPVSQMEGCRAIRVDNPSPEETENQRWLTENGDRS